MKDYVILTDSCCDLSAGMAEELELHVLPLSFVMEEKEYFNHLDYRDISAKDFYARVRGGALGTTSAINVAVFTEAIIWITPFSLSDSRSGEAGSSWRNRKCFRRRRLSARNPLSSHNITGKIRFPH